MRSLFYFVELVLFVGFVVVTVFSVFQGQTTAVGNRRGAGGTQVSATPVEVASITLADLTDQARFTGSMLPPAQFTVAPKVAGRLKRLSVDVGDAVRSGQVVAELDDEEFVQAVAQAEAELAIARANVTDSQAQLDSAKRDLERVKAMRLQKVSSQAEVETAQAQYDSRAARHEVNKAQVNQKESQVKAARVRLGYTRVDAIWASGTTDRFVGERFTAEGAQLSANAPIVSVYQLDPLIAVLDVVERDYFKIRQGQEAKVSVAALPGKSFPGRVVRISPVLSAVTRQARIEVEVPNPGFVLKPGMFVTVDLDFATRRGVQAVPITAFTSRKGVDGLFLIASGAHTARFVPIEKGIVQQQLGEIASPTGLDGVVVTLGQHLLEDGSAVILPGEIGVASGSERTGKRGGKGERGEKGEQRGERGAEGASEKGPGTDVAPKKPRGERGQGG